MKQLQQMWSDIMEKGENRPDRTGVGTTEYFGGQYRYDLSEGFPLMTLRKLGMKFIVRELLWFLSGSTNIKDLKSTIWNQWALPETRACGQWPIVRDDLTQGYGMLTLPESDPHVNDEMIRIKEGEIGPMYGMTWRRYPGGVIRGIHYPDVDQISEVIKLIKDKPASRRMIVTAWLPSVLPDENKSPIENVAMGNAALAACHTMFQFWVSNLNGEGKPKLNCQLYQRSADALVGVPANIASYALLTHLIANEVGYDVGEFIHTVGCYHIYNYESHQKCYDTLMAREPKALPRLVLPKGKEVLDITEDDIVLEGYDPHPALDFKMDVAE